MASAPIPVAPQHRPGLHSGLVPVFAAPAPPVSAESKPKPAVISGRPPPVTAFNAAAGSTVPVPPVAAATAAAASAIPPVAPAAPAAAPLAPSAGYFSHL